MNLKKRLSKVEFIKNALTSKNIFRCQLCKYYILNYETQTMSKTARHFFRQKCTHCKETFKLKKRKIPYWAKNNFKPLYDWEPGNKGEKNE